ncbi:MAG: acetyltransferase [Planctomycetota bacterium]
MIPSDSSDGIALVGCGGHAKVIRSLLRRCGIPIAAVLDDRADYLPQRINEFEVIGRVCDLQNYAEVPVLIAIGCNRTRARVSKHVVMSSQARIDRVAWVDASVTLGDGTVIVAGAIIQPDARIGYHTVVNTSASIDHDCVIGDFVHVGPGVRLGGHVSVGDGSMLGIGCSVLPQVQIGRWAVVGAGATVLEDVPDGTTVVGCPARPIAS